jgi:4-hydroxy-2-oxoheptanedioate aldolase
MDTAPQGDVPTVWLKERLASGRAVIGGWCVIPNPFSAELMARAGFDWICIDTQHGLIDYAGMLSMLQALTGSGVPVLVRVPWNEPGAISKALDAGAQGVIVPMINSVADAQAAVAACRYGPEGYRSWGPTRASLTLPRYTPDEANRRIMCTIQIETLEAVERVDEILSVPGIDAVFVGPMDLAISSGMRPSLKAEDPEQRRMIETILAACLRHGVVPGTYGGSVGMVREWERVGFRLLTADADSAFLRRGAEAMLREIRGDVPTPQKAVESYH